MSDDSGEEEVDEVAECKANARAFMQIIIHEAHKRQLWLGEIMLAVALLDRSHQIADPDIYQEMIGYLNEDDSH